MKPLYAHILLDRSGSMSVCHESTIDAVNEYVRNLAQDAGLDAAISVSLFDTIVASGPTVMALDVIHDGVKATELPKLTKETYVPRGMTPLNDAIGQTVARMDKEWHRPDEAIALVIMTDGLENASREFTNATIKELLEDRQKNKNWMVVYLGANQDAFAEGTNRGIVASHVANYSTAHVGSAMAMAARATSMHGHSGDLKDSAFTEEERRKAATGQ